MRIKLPESRTILIIVGTIILIGGLSSAVLIYRMAQNSDEQILGYDESGDTIRPEDSKQYLRSLELYGGKANVLADKLRRGFLSLWQGKSLAIIIGLAATITSLGFFYAARNLPDISKSEHLEKDRSY